MCLQLTRGISKEKEQSLSMFLLLSAVLLLIAFLSWLNKKRRGGFLIAERGGEEEMLERVPALESLECCFALPLRSAPREDIYIQEECADAGLSLRTTRKLCNARRGLIGQ